MESEIQYPSDDGVDGQSKSDETVSNFIKHRMLSRLSNSDAFFKSQQLNEEPLSCEEKYKISSEILAKSPGRFLERFWKKMHVSDLEYFNAFIGDYHVDFYVRQIIKMQNPSLKKNCVQNRRFQASKEMIQKGSYFSEEEMKSRDPYLYEQMIGKYLSSEEIIEKSKRDLSMSGFLLGHIDQQIENFRYQILKDIEEGQVEEEESDDDDDNDEENVKEVKGRDSKADGKSEQRQISPEEKQQLKDEFLKLMQERFLTGKDIGFDYKTVDENDKYDSVDVWNQDQQDKYFDEDSHSGNEVADKEAVDVEDCIADDFSSCDPECFVNKKKK